MIKEKNNETGLRILEVLKILLREDVTKHQLIQYLRENLQIDGVYTQEAFIKYFNTLEALGLNINKNGKLYKLTNALYNIEFTSEEENIIIKLLSNAYKLYNTELEDSLYNLFKKIQKYTNLNLENKIEKIKSENKRIISENVKNNIISTLVNYINDKQLVYIKYKKNNNIEENVIVEIKSITEKKGRIYITCFNKIWNRNKRICMDYVTEMKQLAKRTLDCEINNPYIFEVYGRLVKSYRLKPSEKVINYDTNRLTVSNSDEDRETLLLRLLKYGENCKILKPKNFQDEFMNLTESILSNLGAEV